MSPRLSVICYDALVYSLDVTNGRTVLKSEAAVDAYNDIQFIAAEENIYFQQREDGEYVRQRFVAAAGRRVAQGPRKRTGGATTRREGYLRSPPLFAVVLPRRRPPNRRHHSSFATYSSARSAAVACCI
jgi:hypothetical protein